LNTGNHFQIAQRLAVVVCNRCLGISYSSMLMPSVPGICSQDCAR
jgi:hypothetical protein